MKLTIIITEGNMEQSTFRARSFRRFFLASCCTFLIIITLHTIDHHHNLQQRVTGGYQHINRKDDSSWASRPRHVGNEQVTIHDEDTSLYRDHSSLEGYVKKLPDVIRIPFEEAVKDVSLEGWEDEWLSSAKFNSDRHGTLQEPKLDFVYNCESILSMFTCVHS